MAKSRKWKAFQLKRSKDIRIQEVGGGRRNVLKCTCARASRGWGEIVHLTFYGGFRDEGATDRDLECKSAGVQEHVLVACLVKRLGVPARQPVSQSAGER